MKSEIINHYSERQTLEGWFDNVGPGEKITIIVSDDASNEKKHAEPTARSWDFRCHQAATSVARLDLPSISDLLGLMSREVEIISINSQLTSTGEAPPLGYKNCDHQEVQIVLRKHFRPSPHILSRSKQDLIERALRLYASKEYESVLDLFDKNSLSVAYSADILNAAGASAFALKCTEYAISLYHRATEVMPTHYDAWNNLGIALCDAGKLCEAEVAHRRAIELRPEEVSFQGDLVKLLIRVGALDEAENICDVQITANPKALFFLGELGTIYTRKGKLQKAHEQYSQILAIEPHAESTALNCGVRLFQAGYLDQAELIYRNASSKYHSEMAQFHLSLLLLAKGAFSEGWRAYEARKVLRKDALPSYQFSQWSGEDIKGKSMLISFEQGFGDEIMMSRYVGELKKAGASRVGMVCRRALVYLFKTIEDAEILTPEHGESVITLRDDQFDFWTLPFDIPRYLNTDLDSIPARVPYLSVPPSRRHKWQKMLGQDHAPINVDAKPPKLRVGLVWKGSVLHRADAERSLRHLEDLSPLWKVPGVLFYSLQKGQGEGEVGNAPKNQPLINLGSAIEDFADSAAIVNQLDLVISVDTAIVHIAGALNKPCWVLIPRFATDWRWMIDREDSPWYPSLRLFRQDHSGNWDLTIEHVAKALAQLVNCNKNALKNNLDTAMGEA